MKGRRPRPLDDGDSGRPRVSGQLSRAKPDSYMGQVSNELNKVQQLPLCRKSISALGLSLENQPAR